MSSDTEVKLVLRSVGEVAVSDATAVCSDRVTAFHVRAAATRGVRHALTRLQPRRFAGHVLPGVVQLERAVAVGAVDNHRGERAGLAGHLVCRIQAYLDRGGHRGRRGGGHRCRDVDGGWPVVDWHDITTAE